MNICHWIKNKGEEYMCDKKVKASDFFVPDPLYDEFKECQERNEKISNMAKNLKNA